MPLALAAGYAAWTAWRARGDAQVAALVAAAAALVAVVGSGALSRQVVAALRALERVTAALGRGERGGHGAGPGDPASPAEPAADALLASRRRLEELLDATPAGMLVLEPERLTVRSANRAALRLLGDPFRGGGLAGRPLDELLPRAAAAGVVEALRRVAADGEPQAESELCVEGLPRGTGWWRWSARRIAAERGGAELVLALTDATEVVRARERADTERRRLEVLLRTLPVGVFVADAGGQLASVNEEARRIWGGDAAVRGGLAAREYRGRRAGDGRPLEPGDWPLERALRGEASEGELVEIDRADGTPGAILASAAPLRDGCGRITGAVSAILDVTELRRATRHRDEVLQVISDELRTPLATVLLGAGAVASLPDGPGALARARATARRVETAGSRMARLVEDLLDLAAIEDGTLPIRRAPCHPVDLLAEAADAARAGAEEKGLDVCLVAEPGLPDVDCDRARILQVLASVIADAVKATEEGCVSLAAEARGAEVVFRVRDTGRSIPAAELPHVFERPGHAPPPERGGGLGLVVARGIVAAHGGEIRAEGAPGEGAVVSFTLPAAPRADDGAGDDALRAGAA